MTVTHIALYKTPGLKTHKHSLSCVVLLLTSSQWLIDIFNSSYLPSLFYFTSTTFVLTSDISHLTLDIRHQSCNNICCTLQSQHKAKTVDHIHCQCYLGQWWHHIKITHYSLKSKSNFNWKATSKASIAGFQAALTVNFKWKKFFYVQCIRDSSKWEKFVSDII